MGSWQVFQPPFSKMPTKSRGPGVGKVENRCAAWIGLSACVCELLSSWALITRQRNVLAFQILKDTGGLNVEAKIERALGCYSYVE